MDHFFQKYIYVKIFCVLSIDLLIILISLPLAYLIRTEDIYLYLKNFDVYIHLVLCLSYIFLFFLRNLHLESMRYFNINSFFNYLLLYICIFIVFILYDFFIKKDYEVLRSIPIIFLLISFGSSILFRVLVAKIVSINKFNVNNELVFIYGANENGVALSRYFYESKGIKIKSFIDDELYQKQITGISVIKFKEFEKKFKKKNFKIYISFERNSLNFNNAIHKLGDYSNNLRIFSSSKGNFQETFRKIELSDFFARDEKTQLSNEAINKIRGSVVAITGGGGSIGSKLAEKVFSLYPKTLILIDFHEFSLVKINNKLNEQRKLNQSTTDVKIILLNLSETKRLNNLLENNSIDILYHCAAYKHVDVSEDEKNFDIFIKNNFINTKNLIVLCLKNRIKSFILVSTDKAVKPSNVMGSTKRLCEIYLLELIKRLNLTNYKIVRFGNVFRSSGSVIPLFEKQIQESNEITITDANVKRFFMSINEAGLLILESTIIINKNLLILEMGEQIKILDIAKLLIKLNSDKEIKLKFIGLKKGEKMEEELSYTPLEKSNNPSIFSSNENFNSNKFAEVKFFEKNYFKWKIKTKKDYLEKLVKY